MLEEQYQNEQEPGKKSRYINWQISKGLQAVDGIKTSDYLDEVAKEHIEGQITSFEASELIDSYYEIKEDREQESGTEEADKVAARINILIGEGGFSLTSDELKNIHKRLFEGIYEHAGFFRKNNIIKHEWVLDGDTVTYGNAYNLEGAVDNALHAERLTLFRQLDEMELVYHFSNFTSMLWRIHPFGEGNTRTTAVFLIKYLRSLGIDADNCLFEKNSKYFRDALVRANYTNIKKGVYADRDPLDNFFENLITGRKKTFSSRSLHIYADTDKSIKGLHGEALDKEIIKLIDKNDTLTRAQMAKELGVSVKTIERHLAQMPNIRYEGSAKKGRWVKYSFL